VCHRQIMTRETTLRERLELGLPDLAAELHLYPTDAGGRRRPIGLGWGCPCSKDQSCLEAWTGYPLLTSEMVPGERRRLGFVFLFGSEAVLALGSCAPLHVAASWLNDLVANSDHHSLGAGHCTKP
jgi:hypothetical protein